MAVSTASEPELTKKAREMAPGASAVSFSASMMTGSLERWAKVWV